MYGERGDFSIVSPDFTRDIDVSSSFLGLSSDMTSQEFVQTMNTIENFIVYVSLTLISCGIRYRTNLFIVVPLNCIHIKYQSQLKIFLNLIKL